MIDLPQLNRRSVHFNHGNQPTGTRPVRRNDYLQMRAVVLAMAPNQEGRSFTSAKLSLFKEGAWQAAKEMSMEAYLSMTPSFEYSVPDTPYRFVVMPGRIVPVSPDGQYLAVGETTQTTIWHFN